MKYKSDKPKEIKILEAELKAEKIKNTDNNSKQISPFDSKVSGVAVGMARVKKDDFARMFVSF